MSANRVQTENADSKPTINWPYIAFVILISGIGLGFTAWVITAQVYREWSQGHPISNGWSWPLVIVVDFACLCAFLALLWKLYRDAKTIFDGEQLSQPGLFGWRTIRWSEVTRLEVFNGVGYHVIADRNKIVVSPYAYSNPEAVKRTVIERVRENTPSINSRQQQAPT